MISLVLLSLPLGAIVKLNANDPGATIWLGHGGCPGQSSPIGMTTPVVLADPFLFSGLPGKPLAAKHLTADGKNLLAASQNFLQR